MAPSAGDQTHPRAGSRRKYKIITSVSMSSWAPWVSWVLAGGPTHISSNPWTCMAGSTACTCNTEPCLPWRPSPDTHLMDASHHCSLFQFPYQLQSTHQNLSFFCLLVKATQSCPTLCDPMDYNLPGSSVHGILQARMMEWVTIPFSMGSSWPRDQTQVSCAAGRFLTVWATREAFLFINWLFITFSIKF